MFSEELINTFPSYNLRDELGCVPTLQEGREALSMIAGGKTSGSSTSGILKVCNDELLGYLVQVFSGVGRVRLFHRTGVILYWFWCLRRVTYLYVTIREG